MLIISSLLRLPSPLISVEILLFSLLQNYALQLCIYVNVWAWSNKTVLKCIQHFKDNLEIKWSAETWQSVKEYKPTVNLPFLQLNNGNAFQHMILKESWKTETKPLFYIFISLQCSKQCLQNPLQDTSMQLHSTGCRHACTKSCKHGRAWFTDLSM